MTEITTKYYTFSQNNSGGSFDFNETTGITHYVIVEAVDAAHATSRAENIGLYWNGCDDGRDCDCCGDRWHTPYDEGDDEPMVYGQKVRGEKVEGWPWMDVNREIAVHPINGPIEWYGMSKKD